MLEPTVRMDAADHFQQQDPGDASGEATPVPIPNTEVKLSSAEDTERAAFRENRSSPGFLRFQGLRRHRASGAVVRHPAIHPARPQTVAGLASRGRAAAATRYPSDR